MNSFNREAQRRLMTVTAQLTATEGPLRLALNELGRFGIGERILKSAVAATLAWLVAGEIPRESAPFIAALTAVYTIDLTIVKSLLQAGQRLAGIALGIGVAFLAAELVGVHSWSVGLVILISLVIGLRLNLKPEGMVQVAGTAIVVMVVRSTTEERGIYSLNFLADTVIGTAIGLIVNALIAPPNFLPGTQRVLNLLVQRLADFMDEMAMLVVDGVSEEELKLLAQTAGQIRADLAAVDGSLANAQEGLRFNLMAGRQRDRLDHFHSVDVRLERVIAALSGLLASLGSAGGEFWLAERRLTEPIANLINSGSTVLRQQGLVESDDRAGAISIDEVLDRVRDLEAVADELMGGMGGRSRTRLGHLVESAIELADSMAALND